MPYFTLPLLVPGAALQRFLFRDSEFNLMECYVLQIYVHGHVFLIHAICAAFGAYGSSIVYVVLLQLVSILLLVWGLKSFPGTPWMSTVLKALILAVVSRLLFASVGLAFQFPRSA